MHNRGSAEAKGATLQMWKQKEKTENKKKGKRKMCSKAERVRAERYCSNEEELELEELSVTVTARAF